MDATEVTVSDVTTVGPDTVAITLETPTGFDADPGQFVLFRVDVEGEEITRYYTLSSPTVGETFEVTVEIDSDGDLSPWLADLTAGDAVVIEGPFGDVSYAGDGPVLALGGGPGIGPALAIGERARMADNDATVIYLDEEPVHEGRLAELSAAGGDVTIVSDGEAFTAAVGEQLDGATVYVFGFQEFCDDALAAIERAGGDPAAANVESFG